MPIGSHIGCQSLLGTYGLFIKTYETIIRVHSQIYIIKDWATSTVLNIYDRNDSELGWFLLL